MPGIKTLRQSKERKRKHTHCGGGRSGYPKERNVQVVFNKKMVASHSISIVTAQGRKEKTLSPGLYPVGY